MKTLESVLESYSLTKDLLSDKRFVKFVDVLQWWIVNEYSTEVENFLKENYQKINTKYRIGNIEVRPIIDTELTYDILKWTPNKFYGKESEYNWSGDIAHPVDFPRVNIDRSCFEKEETAFVIGRLEFLEDSPNIEEISTRVIDLTDEELLDYKKILRQSIQTYMKTGKL